MRWPCVAVGGLAVILLRDAFPAVLVWWSFLFLLGMAALPLTRAILGGLHDQGYPFSKAIGLGLVSYLSWLAASVGFLPLARWSTALLVGGLAGATLSSRTHRVEMARFLVERRRSIARQECLFFALVASWSFVRGMRPDIHGLEKFMDHGFAASIVRSRFMPPQDMWFAGESINYYYFGHYVLAFLSELSGIRLAVAYNLMIATLLALCFTLTRSLAAEIARSAGKAGRGWLLAGTVSATLLTFGGNLHTFAFAVAAPVLEGLGAGSVRAAVQAAERYSYVEATRYVGYRPPTADKTIHEFPLYSFVVSDLHGHVSNIPFVLTLLAILTGAFLAKGGPSGVGSLLGVSLPLRFVVAAAGALALSRMTNAWDLPIYLCVTAAVVFARSLARTRSLRQSVADAGLTAALILVVCWGLTFPFNAHFQNHYSELGRVHTHTPARQALVLWGVPFVLLALYGAAGVAILRARAGVWNAVRHPLATFSALRVGDQLILALAACAAGLVAAPEILYVRDIYGAEFYRANTYFKFGYQAFVLFGAIAGCLAYRVVDGGARLGHSGLVRTLCVSILLLPLLYAPFAIRGFYGTLWPDGFEGLDGLAFLDRDGTGDGPAVRWLTENVRGSPVVLEASGNSFSDSALLSMATGLPTVLGWYAHEGLWRGSMRVPEERARAVALVYEAGSTAKTLEIIRRYGVQFIVVGRRERETFAGIDETKLLGLGAVVFESGGTRIIRVRR